MYLKHLSFRGDFGKLTEWVEARAERHFQKQKAAPVSAQHLIRGSGDVRAFCIERWYVLAFDEASLVVSRQCEGCNLLLGKRQGNVKNGARCSFHRGEAFLGRNSRGLSHKEHESLFQILHLCSHWAHGVRDSAELVFCRENKTKSEVPALEDE